MRSRIAITALALVALAATAGAQGRQLRRGVEVSGSLDKTSEMDAGKRFEEWTYTAGAGVRLVVSMDAEGFDAYLGIGRRRGGRFVEMASDDDGGEGLDALLRFVTPEAGEYVIRASHAGDEEAGGTYVLTLEERTVVAPRRRGAIALDREVEGSLDAANEEIDEWTFTGRAGERIVIDMRSSAIDSKVAIGRLESGAFSELAEDDDGGEGLDSRLRFRLPEDGQYVIRAGAVSGRQSGAYALRVTTGSASSMAVTKDGGGNLRQAGRLTLGEERTSRIDVGDVHEWTFTAAAGQRVTIDMSSGDFDSYVAVGRRAGGRFDELDEDDDGGEGLDSRLRFTPTEDGEYVVRASAAPSARDGSGSYRIIVAGGGSGAPRRATAAGIRIDAGTVVSGALATSDARLNDNSYYDEYVYTARRGERITVVMRSTAFDTYLNVGRMQNGEFVSIQTNDDDANAPEPTQVSRVEIVAPADGPIVIRANSLRASTTGAYTVRVTTTMADVRRM